MQQMTLFATEPTAPTAPPLEAKAVATVTFTRLNGGLPKTFQKETIYLGDPAEVALGMLRAAASFGGYEPTLSDWRTDDRCGIEFATASGRTGIFRVELRRF